MAKLRTRPSRPKFVTKLVDALSQTLAELGIDAEVDSQAVPGTKLHRIMVVSRKFDKMRYTEAQNVVSRIAESVLTPQEQLRISMILTLTPKELEGEAD